MTRRPGLRSLRAFRALSLACILGFAVVLTSIEPATPTSLTPLAPPAQEATNDPEPVVAVEVALDPPAPEPAPDPAPDPEPEPEPEPAPAPAPEPCADALAWVAAAGLPLPAGVDYLCPSTLFAHHGAACWDAWPCPGGAFIAINLELGAGATPEYLRHVVAHEVCHILDFRDRGWSTEPRADACAARLTTES